MRPTKAHIYAVKQVCVYVVVNTSLYKEHRTIPSAIDYIMYEKGKM